MEQNSCEYFWFACDSDNLSSEKKILKFHLSTDFDVFPTYDDKSEK